jgi:hypothetical protein
VVSVTLPHDRISLFSRPGSATYVSGSSSIDPAGLTRLSGPRSRPTATQKIWRRRGSNPGVTYVLLPENGESKFHHTIHIHIQNYTPSHPTGVESLETTFVISCQILRYKISSRLESYIFIVICTIRSKSEISHKT